MTDTATDPSKPAVLFYPGCKITELEPDVEYAAYLRPKKVRAGIDIYRTVKVVWAHSMFLTIADPDLEPDKIVFSHNEVMIVGLWNDPLSKMMDWVLDKDQTWQQRAAHEYGQVLRQRALAARLSAFGIQREPESYLRHNNTSNAVLRSLTLNYDELDKLLTAAGA